MHESTFLFWKDCLKMLSFEENGKLVWKVEGEKFLSVRVTFILSPLKPFGTGLNISNKTWPRTKIEDHCICQLLS